MERSWTIRNKFGQLFSGRRGRDLREYLTAYLMISLSILLVFLFGLFPVGYVILISPYKWRLERSDSLVIE
ncbi:MAG: hypothetical protein FVQ83_03655 [Chloroflexi bacterium]|nr:hypothetical protein [Chloroflexota bacterium]